MHALPQLQRAAEYRAKVRGEKAAKEKAQAAAAADAKAAAARESGGKGKEGLWTRLFGSPAEVADK